MTRLPETAVCMACGRPYLVAQGHACAGPRTASATQTARRSVFSTATSPDPPQPRIGEKSVTTVDERPPEKITDYREAALKFRATGRTSRALRTMAANEEMTRGLALMSGITEDEEREQVLGIADAIDVLEARRLTPEDCYNLAGLDKVFGCPFAEFDPDANWYEAPAPQPVPAPRTAPDGAPVAA